MERYLIIRARNNSALGEVRIDWVRDVRGCEKTGELSLSLENFRNYAYF